MPASSFCRIIKGLQIFNELYVISNTEKRWKRDEWKFQWRVCTRTARNANKGLIRNIFSVGTFRVLQSNAKVVQYKSGEPALEIITKVELTGPCGKIHFSFERVETTGFCRVSRQITQHRVTIIGYVILLFCSAGHSEIA